MSLSRLLIAARNQLRSKLALLPAQCMVRPDGRPNPDCGDLFIAIHGSANQAEEELEVGIARMYGISCSITMRTSFVGDDLQGDESYVKLLTGIEDVAERVEGYIHKRFEVMYAANQMIRNSTYKIIEPLRWTDTDAVPTIVRNDWFNSASTQNEEYAGMVMVVRFSQARRKQPYSDYP